MFDYIETGRFSQASWITDEELNSRNASPALVKRRKESSVIKLSDASRWGLNLKTDILYQNYSNILNHPSVNYNGNIPEELTLISTASDVRTKLFNLFHEQRFGFVSVDRKGAHPINYGSTFRSALSIKECEKINWSNNRLNLWYLKCRLYNVESTERNHIRFFSNIGRERPFVILLIDRPFRYKADSKYLVNLTISEPNRGGGAEGGERSTVYAVLIISATYL